MKTCLRRYLTITFFLCFVFPPSAQGQSLGYQQTELTKWLASKDGYNWLPVSVPHSFNAIDGHSADYYRGITYYKKIIYFNNKELQKPLFLLFEGAAQAAQVFINSQLVAQHKGGYTPFIVPLKNLLIQGNNIIEVACDNHEDPTLIPVSSDFNKNNGLHNPVYLLQMNSIYCSPQKFGLYRMHIHTPQVSKKQAQTCLETNIINESYKAAKFIIQLKLKDAKGNTCYETSEEASLKSNESKNYKYIFTLNNPHLWDGLNDPYLYQAVLTLQNKKGKELDKITAPIGYRFYQMTADKGFYLNGHSYPLRGVAEHQDLEGKASALLNTDYDKDYKIIKELGANFLRLAHYPHNDYEYRKCDSLGIIVQTEIPWVNVCGKYAQPSYFQNIRQQMREMIINLYNHPSIVFWGMWNEIDTWGNKPWLQGTLDTKKVVDETAKLYNIAKALDPNRFVGLTECSVLKNKGYNTLKCDYISENRYNGWYYKVGNMNTFTNEMKFVNKEMGICNVAEYGAGINPFCHTVDTLKMQNRKNNAYHYEEYGNLVHESHVQQIIDMPFLNFTSAWILFDFPVANRTEGFMDSDDGKYFTENKNRKYINDKGLVTRDRKIKKDIFYLYKSLWNKKETTVYITSHRLHSYPENKPIYIKVYSNAKSLTLYQNGEKIETKQNSGEKTGVIWTFGPMKFKSLKDTFKVLSNNNVSDEITWKSISI